MTVLDPYALVGQRVREARAAAGLTQAGLASALGWKQHHVSELENGKRPVSLDKLNALAGALGVTMSDLVSDKPIGTR